MKGHKNWIATTLDIIRKDRTELDLNPSFTQAAPNKNEPVPEVYVTSKNSAG